MTQAAVNVIVNEALTDPGTRQLRRERVPVRWRLPSEPVRYTEVLTVPQ